jgi:hypothetical protein
LNLPIPSNAAIIAAVGIPSSPHNGFGPHSAACRNTNNRNIRGNALFRREGCARLSSRSCSFIKDAGGLSRWLAGKAREVGQQSLPEIATRLTRRRDALSHEKSSIRVGRIDVFAAPIARR